MVLVLVLASVLLTLLVLLVLLVLVLLLLLLLRVLLVPVLVLPFLLLALPVVLDLWHQELVLPAANTVLHAHHELLSPKTFWNPH